MKTETTAQLMEVLKKMYGPDIPDPTEIYIPRWAHDPLFRGSFSQWPTGFTSEDHDRLEEPVGRLYFAGEGYSRYYFGYVHGALLSGQQVALDVISSINGKVNNRSNTFSTLPARPYSNFRRKLV